MINIGKFENIDNLKIIFRDGTYLLGDGRGLALAEDFEDEEDQFDTFYVFNEGRLIALKIDEIENIEIVN